MKNVTEITIYYEVYDIMYQIHLENLPELYFYSVS